MRTIAAILVLLPPLVWASTISGRVTRKQDNAPLSGANVVAMGTKLGASTNASGHYSLRNVPTGQIILRTIYDGYLSVFDTLTISSPDSSYTVDMQLHPDKIPGSELWEFAAKRLSPPEYQNLKAYQDSLADLTSRPGSITVRLDSLVCIPRDEPFGTSMSASLTFHNNSALPVYLLKHYPCMQTLHAVIVDSDGDTVRSHEVFTDLLGEKCHYDTTDMIVVPPHGGSRYPMSIIWLQSCRSLPNTLCSIRIVYSYDLPESIFEASRLRPDQSIPYLRALRGTFASENTMFLHGE